MKKNIVIVFLISLELFFCVFLCVKSDDKKYEKWLETEAVVVDIDVLDQKNGFRSNQSSYIYVGEVLGL